MPETGIGLFPDVGGTFLLSRAPGELGTHVAMTAGHIGAGRHPLGLADSYVPSAQLPALVAALHESAGAADVQACISHFAWELPPGSSPGVRAWIDACYAHDEAETNPRRPLGARGIPAAREAAEGDGGEVARRAEAHLARAAGGPGARAGSSRAWNASTASQSPASSVTTFARACGPR